MVESHATDSDNGEPAFYPPALTSLARPPHDRGRPCVSLSSVCADTLVTTGAEKHCERRGARLSLSPPLPRNRSFGNLAVPEESQESERTRYSFDSSQLGTDPEALTRWVTQPPCCSLAEVDRDLL